MYTAKRDPDIVTETGMRLWVNEDITAYAQVMKGLKGLVCFDVEFPTGEMNRVLFENGEPIFEEPSTERMCGFIDIIKLTDSFHERRG